MNIKNEALDAWAALAEQMGNLARRAQRTVEQECEAALEELGSLSASLLTRLMAAGARSPHALRRPRYDVPLVLLDTPANRRYASALRAAWEAGLAVDRERYGADIGTDGAAQIIEMVLADVEQEIHGAEGMVQD
jgi:hypothetical protein